MTTHTDTVGPVEELVLGLPEPIELDSIAHTAQIGVVVETVQQMHNVFQIVLG